MPPPSVLSPHGPQLQTYLARSSSPGGWPEFLLHSQVDFEALDRPLLLGPVTPDLLVEPQAAAVEYEIAIMEAA